MEAPLLLPVSTAAASSSIDIDDTVEAASPAASSPSTQSIVFRVVAVLVVACASLFAQHEASKGFHIDVVNDAPRDTVAGRRFDLFFVSDGRAERILHYANRGVERALFPDASFPRKRVTRVTVKMAGHNLTADATLDAAAPGEYVIALTPSLVSSSDKAADAVDAAVRRAVARMWLWDGRGGAPARVTDSMVEYLAFSVAGDAAMTSQPEQEEGQQCMSARFLRHLEQRREGFVARLNRAMRDRWSDAAVDAALGAPARHACASYHAATALTGHGHPAATLAESTSDAARGSMVAM
ncbi:uncharacterized protein LOC133883968 [Phragmites australis]|uniref:uncharacterized protein LOC133883968 n=1 Tax=Phragmites australis TaxID=29695 RepID=UPI002D79A6FA|nr:uncharacterized protein LOC133883968 [Phragmites australis]